MCGTGMGYESPIPDKATKTLKSFTQQKTYHNKMEENPKYLDTTKYAKRVYACSLAYRLCFYLPHRGLVQEA